jgi:hypothetical protein|tara:strand:- start:152 stop:559 length:408 start_codon:yes stop_codon:yes gene_type:complete
MSDLAKELPTYYIIKFHNGEEIICSLKQADEETVKLVHPMRIHAYPKMTETGQVKEQIALHRWLHPYTNEIEFEINKKDIMTLAKCSDTMMTYYENFLYKRDDINVTHKEVQLKSDEEKKHRRDYITVETDKDVH